MTSAVIVLHTYPEHIAATIDASVAQLRLTDSEGEHTSRCEALKTALVQLSNQLNQFRVSGQHETRGIRLLVQARISASITYHVVYKLAHDPEKVECTCCWSSKKVDGPVAQALDSQLKETLTLLGLLADYAHQIFAESLATIEHNQEPQRHSPSPSSVRSGVCTLTLTTPKRVDDKIANGVVLSFPVTDASPKVIYTVKTWINNPAAWFKTARRLAASLEIEQEDGSGQKEMDIRLPEQKEDPTSEQTAFLSVAGSQQAVVKSFPPDNVKVDCCGVPTVKPATLLKRDHTVPVGDQSVYENQVYDIEVRLSTNGFEIGLQGGALHAFRVQGMKEEYKVSYVCFVQETNEVLAIYRLQRREHRGVFQFIGLGNYPALRDLIMGAFVAMGLHSEL